MSSGWLLDLCIREAFYEYFPFSWNEQLLLVDQWLKKELHRQLTTFNISEEEEEEEEE